MVKNKFVKAIIGVVALFIIAFFAAFVFRQRILNFALEKFRHKFEATYKASFESNELRLLDINAVCLNNIAIIPTGRGPFLRVKSVLASIDIFTLLTGKIRLTRLEVKDVSLVIFEKDSINNYDFLYKKKTQKKSSNPVKSKNYAEAFNRIVDSFFENTPRLIDIQNIQALINRNDQIFRLQIPALTVKDKVLSARIIDQSDGKGNSWSLLGLIDSKNEKLNVKVYSLSSGKAELPFLFNRYGLKTSFDTLHLNLDRKELTSESLQLEGRAEISNLFVNHKRLSPHDVLIAHVELFYNLLLGENSIQLDSSSSVRFNNIVFKPFLKYVHTDSLEKDILVKINSDTTTAHDFFESLPKGMFDNLEGIQAEGNLKYTLDFHINTKQPDSLHFNSTLSRKHFKILKYGASYLPKINADFKYTAFENGVGVRSFEVGPSNPDFTPYEEIAEYLKYALLTSEDGNFFYHAGFNEEAFAKSIATNFKLGKFARGGSTISMQLVKNVFLTRNKTITRKLEEALIVWLIENNHLSTKQRMYEVYLNIIEWGPGIYGIKEASLFYFDKLPSQLNLSESIFLASIVPSPKAFKYSFDKEGNLRGYLEGYFKLVASRLLRKSIITEAEYEGLETNVVLRGRAKKLVVPADSSAIFIQDDEEQVK
jgi:hypothetical protein